MYLEPTVATQSPKNIPEKIINKPVTKLFTERPVDFSLSGGRESRASSDAAVDSEDDEIDRRPRRRDTVADANRKYSRLQTRGFPDEFPSDHTPPFGQPTSSTATWSDYSTSTSLKWSGSGSVKRCSFQSGAVEDVLGNYICIGRYICRCIETNVFENAFEDAFNDAFIIYFKDAWEMHL